MIIEDDENEYPDQENSNEDEDDENDTNDESEFEENFPMAQSLGNDLIST
jgi:hypothetical protein